MSSKGRGRKSRVARKRRRSGVHPAKVTNSLLDEMKKEMEFQSILKCRVVNLDIVSELRKAIARSKELESTRYCATCQMW